MFQAKPRYEGVVVNYSERKQFGFIRAKNADGEDAELFFHFKSYCHAGVDSMFLGQRPVLKGVHATPVYRPPPVPVVWSRVTFEVERDSVGRPKAVWTYTSNYERVARKILELGIVYRARAKSWSPVSEPLVLTEGTLYHIQREYPRSDQFIDQDELSSTDRGSVILFERQDGDGGWIPCDDPREKLNREEWVAAKYGAGYY